MQLRRLLPRLTFPAGRLRLEAEDNADQVFLLGADTTEREVPKLPVVVCWLPHQSPNPLARAHRGQECLPGGNEPEFRNAGLLSGTGCAVQPPLTISRRATRQKVLHQMKKVTSVPSAPQ